MTVIPYDSSTLYVQEFLYEGRIVERTMFLSTEGADRPSSETIEYADFNCIRECMKRFHSYTGLTYRLYRFRYYVPDVDWEEFLSGAMPLPSEGLRVYGARFSEVS